MFHLAHNMNQKNHNHNILSLKYYKVPVFHLTPNRGLFLI